MKTRTSLLRMAAGILPAIGCLAQTNSLEDFVSSVNAAWEQTNTTQVLSLVNQRLSANSNDVCALCLKAYYHVLIDGVLTNGQASADQFNAIVQQGTNTNARAMSQQMRDQVFAVPTNEAAPLTAEQISQIHDNLPTSFPMIEKCKWLATKAGGT